MAARAHRHPMHTRIKLFTAPLAKKTALSHRSRYIIHRYSLYATHDFNIRKKSEKLANDGE